MIRMKINGQNLGLNVREVELKVETIEEAKEWMETQFNNWGVDKERLDENVSFEKLDLLLDNVH